MKKFECVFPPDNKCCRVYAGKGILNRIVNHRLLSDHSSLFAVVDREVLRRYRRTILAELLSGVPVYPLQPGEAAKSFDSLRELLSWLHHRTADRRSLLLAIGGGVTTDLAGFAASCYLRGVDFLSVPTTLVGQVDAALGGKTAINLAGVKNIIGAVHLPRAVVCEQLFLESLKPAALADGLVEMLKLFLALDARAFRVLAQQLENYATQWDYGELTAAAIKLKLTVVTNDPWERGLRRVLNLGHTAGHAYESLTGQSHGKSVAVGLQAALELSHRYFGLPLNQRDQASQAVRSLYPLTVGDHISAKQLWEIIKSDKKRVGGQLNFVLLPRIGKHKIAPVTYRQFQVAWRGITGAD